MPSTATPEQKRALAAEARRRRAARVAQLRHRVVATALATFALAVGVVAYDGSTGATSSTPTSVVADSSVSTDTTDATTADATAVDRPRRPTGDVVTTQQS